MRKLTHHQLTILGYLSVNDNYISVVDSVNGSSATINVDGNIKTVRCDTVSKLFNEGLVSGLKMAQTESEEVWKYDITQKGKRIIQ